MTSKRNIEVTASDKDSALHYLNRVIYDADRQGYKLRSPTKFEKTSDGKTTARVTCYKK